MGEPMSCNFPIEAYKVLNEFTESGKAVIYFKRSSVGKNPFEKVNIPCGRCEGCMITRSRDWAVRCVHEASLYQDNNSFITLTYNDKSLPPQNRNCDKHYINDEGETIYACPVYGRNLKPCIKGSLCKKDFQDFMKRLRKECHGVIPVYDESQDKVTYPIRYYHCGEYGAKLGRPHHHQIQTLDHIYQTYL